MALTKITSTQATYNQGGTGSVIRGLNTKLQETVSVEDFDAVPNDASALAKAQNTIAIQNALNSKTDNLRVTLAGKAFFLDGGIKLYGPNKWLDGEGGVLDFTSASNTYCVDLTPLAAAPAPEAAKKVTNLIINGHSLSNTDNVGVFIGGKADKHIVKDVYIAGVKGTGYWVQGGVTGSGANNSPEKGYHSNIFVSDCTNGVRFDSGADPEGLMTHHIINGCYVASVGTSGKAYYIYSCAQFTFCGIGGESGGAGSYGLFVDDNLIGGGHVFAGGFIEGYTTQFNYANPNPQYGNTVLMKGGAGILTPETFNNSPGTAMNFGPGLVQRVSHAPIMTVSGATRIYTGTVSTIMTVMGRRGQFARILLGTTDGTLTTAFVEMLEKGTRADQITTTKDNAATFNVYAEVDGFYIQNNCDPVTLSNWAVSLLYEG